MLGDHLPREVAEAASQVVRRVQGQDDAGRVGSELQRVVLCPQAVQGRLAVGEVVLEQRRRRRGRFLRLRRRLGRGSRRAEKQGKQIGTIVGGRG